MTPDYHRVPLPHRVILESIEQGSSILDLGCGSGELLQLLVREKQVNAQGIEIDEQAIYKCVEKGLSVFHGDIDSGLSEYGDKSFDYALLNQTLEQVRRPDAVLTESFRVARRVIVVFPNFAHYTVRLQIFFGGKTPVTESLPYRWYDTPNLHFLSISDFQEYCREESITIEKAVFASGERMIGVFPNILAETGIFVISR